jgi:hypothetical protein
MFVGFSAGGKAGASGPPEIEERFFAALRMTT